MTQQHDPNNKACLWFDWKQRNYTFPPEPCTCPPTAYSHDIKNKECRCHNHWHTRGFYRVRCNGCDECTCPPAATAYRDFAHHETCARHWHKRGRYIDSPECTCPEPDEVEQIRARHSDTREELPSPNYNVWCKQPYNVWCKHINELHNDRTALLRIVDQLRAENERIVGESKQCHATNDELVSEHIQLRAELAAKDAILPAVIDTYDLKKHCQHITGCCCCPDELREQFDTITAELAAKDAENELLRNAVKIMNDCVEGCEVELQMDALKAELAAANHMISVKADVVDSYVRELASKDAKIKLLEEEVRRHEADR